MNDHDESQSAASTAADENLSEDQIWNELVEAEGAAPVEDGAADKTAFTQTGDLEDEEEGNAPDAGDGTKTSDNQTSDNDDASQGKSDDAGETSLADRLKEAQEQNARLEHQLSTEIGRSQGQQRRADRLAKEIEELRGRTDTTKQDKERRAQRDAKLKEAQEEYGDVIGPLVETVKELESKSDSLSQDDQRRLAAAQEELKEIGQAEYALMLEEHPDGFKVLTDNAETFKDWIEDQPKRYRDIFESNRKSLVDGKGAALLLSRFKADLLRAESQAAGTREDTPPAETQKDNKLANRRNRQLEGALSTRNGSGNAALTDVPPPDSDDEQAHWAYWAAQDAKKARQKG